MKTRSENNRKSDQANNFGLILLVAPIAGLIWAAQGEGASFPINQEGFLKYASIAGILSYGVVWGLSFYKTEISKTILAVSAFLFLLWFMASFAVVAKVNAAFDKTEGKVFYTKIISAQVSTTATSRLSMGRRAYCNLRVDPPVFSEDIRVKPNECDEVVAGVDGVMLTVRTGTLGLPWLSDHSIIKDFDLYTKKLDIQPNSPAGQ